MLVAAGIVSFVVLFLAMHRDLSIFDEGIILTDAMLVLHGEIIHRDFYSSYGPGQYYIIAGLFRLFGENFMVSRVYDLAVRSAIVAILFYILRKQCLLVIGAYLYPIFPCMLLSLIGSYLVTRVSEGPALSPAFISAGACTGLTAL